MLLFFKLCNVYSLNERTLRIFIFIFLNICGGLSQLWCFKGKHLHHIFKLLAFQICHHVLFNSYITKFKRKMLFNVLPKVFGIFVIYSNFKRLTWAPHWDSGGGAGPINTKIQSTSFSPIYTPMRRNGEIS